MISSTYILSFQSRLFAPTFKSLCIRYCGVKTNTSIGGAYSSQDQFLKTVENRPNLDFEYLTDPVNRTQIAGNIERRKKSGNIDKVNDLFSKVMNPSGSGQLINLKKTWDDLYESAMTIPNLTSPNTPEKPTIIRTYGDRGKPNLPEEQVQTAEWIAGRAKQFFDDLGQTSGRRSYSLFDNLASLQDILTAYVLDVLQTKHGFKFVSVPDILPTEVAQRCGLVQRSEQDILYQVDRMPHWCLSGTGEMGIAATLMDKVLEASELPLYLTTVSTCYRPEITDGILGSGLYRVHQFQKVEMFVVCSPAESDKMFERLLEIQESIYYDLGIHFNVVEMSADELGSPAYRKVDLEAWLPARKKYGEITSVSNCTDYQSRRLLLQYRNQDGDLDHPHTLNGTGIALPRFLIPFLEQYQPKFWKALPKVLKPYVPKTESSKKTKVDPIPLAAARPRSDFSLRLK